MFCAAALVLAGATVRAQVVVTATAGVMGPTMYPTLSAAIADVNAGLPQGIIGIGIMSNITETGPVVLNASGAGPALYTQLTIAPVTDGVTISGPTATGRGLIELNGADNVIIDGDNPNTAGVNRNLTIQNTASNTTTYTSVVRIALSTVVTSADNVIIRNCALLGSATGRNVAGNTSSSGSENTTFGILVGGGASTVDQVTAPGAISSVSATIGAGMTATGFTVRGCSIDACARGISVNGSVTSVVNNLSITNNVIGAATAGNATTVYTRGMTLQGFDNGLIQGNTVRNIESFLLGQIMGIALGDVSASGTNTSVDRNIIGRVFNRNTGTYGAHGITVNVGDAITVSNNFISDVIHDQSGGVAFTAPNGVSGIRIDAGNNHKIYYNSVNLFGAMPGSAASGHSSRCLFIGSTSLTGLDVRNNLFSNTITGGTTSTAHVCIMIASGGTSSMNLTLNNNAYYCGTATNQGVGHLGTSFGTIYTAANFNPASTSPANNMRSYTSTLSAAGTNDGLSIGSSAAAPYISNTDLHLNVAAANIADVNAKAAVVSTTADIDGAARDASTPDIGADEVVVAACASASGGTISPATQSTCAGQVINMSSTGATAGAGITYQWMVATTSGGPYVNVTGGSGATTTAYTTGALTAGTYYYVLQTTCNAGPITGLSNELTVTVNALPTVGVSPASATFCSGGPAIALTATGAVGYAWTPSAGLSATTGANVNASPASSTIYTVTGVDANGCFNTATTSIVAAPTPTVTATATPSVVCTGGNVQMLATAVASDYVMSAIPYAPTVGSGASAVTGDDANSAAITIPFTFTYFGANYTQLFVCSNGYVQMGTTAGPTNVYAQNLPATATPNNMIAGVFSDLNIQGPAQVTTYTTGVSPNRIFTIYFNNCPFYSSSTTTTGNTNFQIQLYETGNVIEIHVGNVTGQSTTTANKTLGIENSTGTAAVSPASRNFVNWTVGTPEAWRFTPTTYTYGWTPPTFLSSTTIANPMANTVTSTTNYTVTVTTNSGCTATGSAGFVVGAPLISSATITPAATVCEGTTVTFNGGATGGGAPYTYSWTGPNSFSSTAQNPTLVTTVAATGTYVLTVTDGCTTVTTSSVTLTVNPNPVVSVTPTSATFCAGSPAVTLTATGAPAYSWAPSTGLSATTGSSVDASPSSSMNYTVTGTDANGCVATATTAIASSAPPTGVVASASQTTICAGDTIDLNGTASPTVSVLSQDFTSLGGWTVINDPGSPVSTMWGSIASPFTYLAGSLDFSNFSTTNGGNFYMSNSDVGGSGSTTNTQLVSPVFSTVGMTSANLTFEHVYQRWASGDVTVAVEISTDGGTTWSTLQAYTSSQGTVTNQAQATTAATISLASYLNQSNLRLRYNYVAVWGYYWIVDNIVVSGNTTYTYDWTSSPASFTSSMQNPTDVVPAGTTGYIVEVSNALGCSAMDTVNVTVNALPSVAANATATTVCMNDAVTFTGSGATSYTWTGGVTDAVPYTPSVTDTYTVTGTDANGCMNTDMITVTVNALPAVVANATATTVCMNDNVTFTGSGATSYTWSGGVTDGVPFSMTMSGDYVVTGTDGNGCMNNDTINVTVNALPAVVANASAAAVCTGDSATVMGGGATSYTWSGGVTDGVPFVVSMTDNYVVTGTDANGCVNMDSITIVANVPTGSLTLPMDTVCQTVGTITLGGEYPAGGMWSGPGVSGNTFDPMTSGLGMIGITYMFTDSNGCSGSVVDSFLVDLCLDVTTPVVSSGVSIYPNPTIGQFTIQLANVPATPVRVELTNELGQVIDAFTMTSTVKDMDITNLEGGVYFVRITNGTEVSVHRLVRQ